MVYIQDNTSAEPAPYGLLSPATTVVHDHTDHWAGGFDYQTDDCGVEVTLLGTCSSSVSATAVEDNGSPIFRSYIPFEVQVAVKCSTMGTTPEEQEKRARDALKACAQKAIEFEFWTGTLAKVAAADPSWDVDTKGAYPNRYLASSDALDVTPTPGTGVKSKQGLALLEQALADCGCGIQGTIHAPRDVASALGIKPKDDRIYTNLGNLVVAGAGYSNTGPDGTPAGAGKKWMYATGPVTVRLGDPMVVPDKQSQAVDIQKNTIVYRASQPAAVTWNSCCHAAVLVDLALDYS